MYLGIDEFKALVPSVEERLERLTEQFIEVFHREPTLVVSAPGRTEIIGNHTDHQNGRVVAAAVDLDALAVAGHADEAESILLSTGYDREFHAVLSKANPEMDKPDNDTERLMLGVASGLGEQGFETPAYNAVLDSHVTAGSGLSSSAALEMALVGVHCGLASAEIDPYQAARAGQHAENVFMGKPSGLMDQMASAAGNAVAIDFGDPSRPRYHQLELDFQSHGHRLMVVNTGGSHADLTEEYAAIPRDMRAVAQALGGRTLSSCARRDLLANLASVRSVAGDRAVLRAFHFFEEQERVSALIDAVNSRLPEPVLRLMTESGRSSWTLLQNVYPQGVTADQPIALGLALTKTYLAIRGATGAFRVHGGGFAGTMLVVIPEELAAEYAHAMERAFGAGSVTELSIRRTGLAWSSI
mgnify:CR=1 FL=1